MITEQATIPAIAIKRIREQSFSIREDLLIDPLRRLKMDIGYELGFALEANLVSLTTRVYYRFLEMSEPILADISVQNVFEVPHLAAYFPDGKELKLPEATISAMVGLSIAHTRSLLAKELSGTALQDNLPVIVDAEEVARHFFPRMFDRNVVVPPAREAFS